MDRPTTTEPLPDDSGGATPPTREASAAARGRARARAETERLPSAAADEQQGATRLVLGRYRIERRLGAGGYGTVFMAWDERLEREVALKVIPHDHGEAGLRRAEREARVAARMSHPGIVALYEMSSDEDAVYLVSELVHGRTYAELLRGGGLSDRDVARIGAALCDALDYAHGLGVVHRDVKPGNVMVVAEPAAGAGFAKLTDFGVAHMATGDPLTRTGDVVGTLAYMAPEQAEGRRVTAAADVYALALTLYEGWTGENPVRARGALATARRVGRPLPALGARRRDLPPELCEDIDGALDPDPQRRPPVASLRESLELADRELSDEGGLVEPGTLERFGLARPPRRLASDHAGVAIAGGLLGRLAPRLVAGLGAGALLLLALDRLTAGEHVFGVASPLAVSAALAALVLALPRIGWLAGGVLLVAWLASPEVNRAGTALVVAGALAGVPPLLLRAGPLWSVPAVAPLLGALGLAPLYVALAGLASTGWRRLGLGLAGFVWLVAAEAVTGEALLFGVAEDTQPAALWESSLRGALEDVVLPFATSAAALPAAIFGLFALAVPLVVRGRLLAWDLLGATAWGAALAAVLAASGDLMAGSVELDAARGGVAGAVLGAAAVAAVAAVRGPRPRERELTVA